jgi:type II secretory pathway pseudopilin PulG
MPSGRQQGFTYLIALLSVAAVSASAAAVFTLWSQARQRDKEAELRWIGKQYQEAIGLYYQRSPGSVKRYPEKLDDLLRDGRLLGTHRYLRKLYQDPMTGKPDWGLVASPTGGIMGVYSSSNAMPVGQIEAGHGYSDWRFVYQPPLVTQATR